MNIYLLKFWSFIFGILKRRSFGFNVRMAFYDKVFRLCSNEVNLSFNQVVEALREQQYKLHKGKSILYFLYTDIASRLSSGASESEALNGFVPDVDAMMINSFKDDDISSGFKNLMDYNIKVKEMNSALLKALTYPGLLFGISIVVVWYFSISLIPALTAALTPDMQLSSASEMMISLSQNFYLYLTSIGLTLIGLIVLLSWALPNYNGSFRRTLEKIPPFSIYRIVNGCGFLNALAALSNSGYQQYEAIEEMKENSTKYLAYRLELIAEQIKGAKNLGSALVDINLDFPDKKMLEDIELISRFGVLEDSLSKMADDMTEKGLNLINKQATVLKHLATGVISFTIMFMFNGIYSLSNDMGNSAEQSGK